MVECGLGGVLPKGEVSEAERGLEVGRGIAVEWRLYEQGRQVCVKKKDQRRHHHRGRTRENVPRSDGWSSQLTSRGPPPRAHPDRGMEIERFDAVEPVQDPDDGLVILSQHGRGQPRSLGPIPPTSRARYHSLRDSVVGHD